MNTPTLFACEQLVAAWRQKVIFYRELATNPSDHACHDKPWRDRQEGKAIATACRADELEAILETATKQDQKHDWRTQRMGGVDEFADERVTSCERCGCELNDDNRNEACPQQKQGFCPNQAIKI